MLKDPRALNPVESGDGRKIWAERLNDTILRISVALVPGVAEPVRIQPCRIALSVSGMSAPPTSLVGAVVFCDGWDEYGRQQPLVTAALHAISAAPRHADSGLMLSNRIPYRAFFNMAETKQAYEFSRRQHS